jgi:peptidoglycan/LPS O-acetylase OafA/YrhL
VIATTLGICVGLAGLEHGLFEALQGSAPTPGLIVRAIGPAQQMWPYVTEEALTVIPDFLVAGIATTAAGLLTIAWSILFIDRPRGANGLLALGAVLFLVGGGIAMLVFLVFGWAVARRIDRPIGWWRGIVPAPIAAWLASRWPWLVAAAIVLYAIAVEIAVFGFVPGMSDPDLILAICWTALLAMLLVLVLALVGASAAEMGIDTRPGRHTGAKVPRSDDGQSAASART